MRTHITTAVGLVCLFIMLGAVATVIQSVTDYPLETISSAIWLTMAGAYLMGLAYYLSRYDGPPVRDCLRDFVVDGRHALVVLGSAGFIHVIARHGGRLGMVPMHDWVESLAGTVFGLVLVVALFHWLTRRAPHASGQAGVDQ